MTDVGLVLIMIPGRGNYNPQQRVMTPGGARG